MRSEDEYVQQSSSACGEFSGSRISHHQSVIEHSSQNVPRVSFWTASACFSHSSLFALTQNVCVHPAQVGGTTTEPFQQQCCRFLLTYHNRGHRMMCVMYYEV